MEQQPDPVVVAALEYESATLCALRALDDEALDGKGEADHEAKIAACLRFSNALAVIEEMPVHDRTEALAYLTRRGRIPHGSWRVIQDAMERFAVRTRAAG